MTGEDHNTDALVAALRSPALPAEQVGEAAAVTAMLEVLAATHSPSPTRARRGVAIAAVTVASLGVGGLVAAGPGIFSAAADTARSLVTEQADPERELPAAVPGDDSAERSDDGSSDTDGDSTDADSTDGVHDSAGAPDDAQPAAEAVDRSDDGVECAEGTHGATVSSVAHATTVPGSPPGDHGRRVSEAARSDCGKPNADDTGDDTSDDSGDESADAPDPTATVECAEGNHGATVSEVAHAATPADDANHGAAVSRAAQSECGKNDGGPAAGTETPVTPADGGTPPANANANANGSGNEPAADDSVGTGPDNGQGNNQDSGNPSQVNRSSNAPDNGVVDNGNADNSNADNGRGNGKNGNPAD